MILDNNNISITKVASALGVNNSSVGALCSSSRINPWAKFRPINSPVVPRLDSTRIEYGNTWRKVKQAAWNTETVDVSLPVYPTGGVSSPYCLGDFRGYNHGALPINFSVQESIEIDEKATSASIPVSIRIPEPTSRQVTDFSDANIIVADRIIGTNHLPTNQGKVGAVAWTDATAGTEQSLTITLNKGLPTAEGGVVSKDVWILAESTSGITQYCYIDGVDKYKKTIRIKRGYSQTPDINNQSQWRIASASIVDGYGNPMSGTGISWTKWEYHFGSMNYPGLGTNDGYSAFRVHGLVLPASMMGDKILEYQVDGESIWREYRRWGTSQSFNGNLFADGSSPKITLPSGKKAAVSKFRIKVDNATYFLDENDEEVSIV